MSLRNWMKNRRAASSVSLAPASTSAQREPIPLTPEQRADLEAARVELLQAMEESQVTSFRACSRNGRHWAEDPDAMRAMAATFRSIKEDLADNATNVPDQT